MVNRSGKSLSKWTPTDPGKKLLATPACGLEYCTIKLIYFGLYYSFTTAGRKSDTAFLDACHTVFNHLVALKFFKGIVHRLTFLGKKTELIYLYYYSFYTCSCNCTLVNFFWIVKIKKSKNSFSTVKITKLESLFCVLLKIIWKTIVFHITLKRNKILQNFQCIWTQWKAILTWLNSHENRIQLNFNIS